MTSSVLIGDSLANFMGSDISSRRASYIVTSMSETDTVDVPISPTASSAETRTRKYGPRSNALDVIPDVDLTGKTMMITGTTSGIGIETARALALRGAHVVMANRNILMSEELKQKIIQEKPDAKIDLITCDLSSLQSVQAAAKEFKEKHWPLHALILSAGVFGPTQKMTIDGLETCYGVNHVAHQYLIRELLPVLRQTEHSRIVIVSSHSHGHTGLKADQPTTDKLAKLTPKSDSEIAYKLYAYSKMCNVLTAMKLHRDENPNGVAVYVLHPGTMIGTSIARGYGVLGKIMNVVVKPFTKTLSQGAATTVYCAASPEVAEVSGKYWESCWDDEKLLHKEIAHDEALQEALWKQTNDLIDEFESKRNPVVATTNE